MGTERIFEDIISINKDYLAAHGIPQEGKYHCFECGDEVTFRNQADETRYFYSGLCQKCEDKALGYDPEKQDIIDELVAINETIDRLIKKLKGGSNGISG